jgi:hypothetical protein
MNNVSDQNEKITLNCPVYFCDRPVNRVVREEELTATDQSELGEPLDCGNENHEHYSCGTLVRLTDTRTTHTMTETQRQEYMAFKWKEKL